jgi:hypothetical protein
MTTNPYLARLESRGKSSHGKASEKKLAKSIGARLTPASGALDSAKGDMKIGDFLIESKSTINKTISLELDFFIKIAHEATFTGKNPALTVSFVNGDGSPKRDSEWVCIPLALFKNIIENKIET